MKRQQQRILTGTALGLLMASTPLAASPLLEQREGIASAPPLILAQAESGSAEANQPLLEQAAPEPHPEPAAAPEPVATPEPAIEQAPAPEPTPVQAQQEPEAAEPSAEPELPRKKRKQNEEQAEPAPAEQSAPAEAAPAQQEAPAAQPEQPRKKRKQSQEQAEPTPAEQAPAEAAPAQQEAPAAEPEQPRKKRKQSEEQPAAEQPAPVETAPEAKPAEPEQKSAEPERKPTEKKPAKEEPAAKPADEPTQAKPAEQPADQPAEQPAQGGEMPASEQPKAAEPTQNGEKPAGEGAATTKPAGEAQPGEQPKAGETTQPAQGEQQPAPAEGGQQPATGGQQTGAPADPNAAPIFDSQKNAQPPAEGQAGGTAQPQQPGQAPSEQPATQPAQPVQQPAEKAPPPVDDKAAQVTIEPEKITPVTEEKGTRLERAPDFDVRRRPRPEGADIVKNFGDRTIIQFNNQVIVESNERPRITRDAQDVYYEDLPRGRTRETIVRDNGNQIITIRNRNGDIIRRSRITPDGQEYVLSYVDERYYEDIDQWRDPGDELPPIYVDIPREEYILESEYVRSPDDYYVFLERPPVEKVKRLYSIDEVKRSARVRDIARRIDLDTLNFEFGSATIPESEVQKLQGVADAMQKLLGKNPAETFLIEGHTDAVGSDVANLALSDRRAEAVANALTNVFDIPPENLTTQGYGERYLKVKSDKPERENRRVAIRRITPLVAPVANAK